MTRKPGPGPAGCNLDRGLPRNHLRYGCPQCGSGLDHRLRLRLTIRASSVLGFSIPPVMSAQGATSFIPYSHPRPPNIHQSQALYLAEGGDSNRPWTFRVVTSSSRLTKPTSTTFTAVVRLLNTSSCSARESFHQPREFDQTRDRRQGRPGQLLEEVPQGEGKGKERRSCLH